jgi:hypothetical protein
MPLIRRARPRLPPERASLCIAWRQGAQRPQRAARNVGGTRAVSAVHNRPSAPRVTRSSAACRHQA